MRTLFFEVDLCFSWQNKTIYKVQEKNLGTKYYVGEDVKIGRKIR